VTKPGNVKKYVPLGTNLSCIEFNGGDGSGNITGKYMYKEFCYYYRRKTSKYTSTDAEEGPPMMLWDETTMKDANDERKPLEKDWLDELGQTFPRYNDWEIFELPFGIQVLRYPLLDGTHTLENVKSFINTLRQLVILHSLQVCHGDLLPRNSIFNSDGSGHLIDFDLSRKVGTRYVQGYNYNDFCHIRHPDAQAGETMEIEHDVYSIKAISRVYFGETHWDGINACTDINEIITYLTQDGISIPILDATGWPKTSSGGIATELKNKATNSPNRLVNTKARDEV
jgi:hypothetical protein